MAKAAAATSKPQTVPKPKALARIFAPPLPKK
jgi:hypothetical protein